MSSSTPSHLNHFRLPVGVDSLLVGLPVPFGTFALFLMSSSNVQPLGSLQSSCGGRHIDLVRSIYPRKAIIISNCKTTIYTKTAQNKKQPQHKVMIVPVLLHFYVEFPVAHQSGTYLHRNIVPNPRCGQLHSSSNDVQFLQHLRKCFLDPLR